jgi:O-6-methylguanine DNA methyltransferase
MILIARQPTLKVIFQTKNHFLEKISLEYFQEGFCATFNETPIDAYVNWLKAYAAKTPLPCPLFSWTNLSFFTKKTLHFLINIPFGQKMSYAEVAAKVGVPKGARAVGNACAANPFPLFVPCHRIIASNDHWGGYSGDLQIKETLLKFEIPNLFLKKSQL